MYSWVAKTEEIDMLDEAIDELKEQVSKMELKKNTVGLAYVYYDTDFDELAALLEENFDFPIVGVSTIALLDNEGYSDYGINLLVLSADDVEFETGITSDLSHSNFAEEIKKTYTDISARKPDNKETLVLAYVGKMLNHSADEYVEVIDELCGGVAIHGGMASDMFQYKDFKVFADGCARTEAVAFLVMYGNVKPIVGVESSVSNVRVIGEPVTKAYDNTIYTLGDKTFREVLLEESICSEDEVGHVALNFMQTPFVIEQTLDDGETVDVLRNIVQIDKENGSSTFLGRVPEGATVKVSSLRPEDIGKSVNQAFERLFAKLKDSKDYKYSTIICVSCTGRYINLVGDKDIEGNAYKDILPDDISLIGMYSYGEICPKKSDLTGKYYNAFHNETFTIVAF